MLSEKKQVVEYLQCDAIFEKEKCIIFWTVLWFWCNQKQASNMCTRLVSEVPSGAWSGI